MLSKRRFALLPLSHCLRKGGFSIDTDACDHQVGFALFQEQEDGKRKAVGYWCRTLTAAEKNYSMMEKECLALVYGIVTCHPYLLGHKFIANIDHSALLKYRRGRSNCHADAASRVPSDSPTTAVIDLDVLFFTAESDLDSEYNLEEPCIDFHDIILTKKILKGVSIPRALYMHEVVDAQQQDEFCQ
eukprot:IDg13079t1